MINYHTSHKYFKHETMNIFINRTLSLITLKLINLFIYIQFIKLNHNVVNSNNSIEGAPGSYCL